MYKNYVRKYVLFGRWSVFAEVRGRGEREEHNLKSLSMVWFIQEKAIVLKKVMAKLRAPLYVLISAII